LYTVVVDDFTEAFPLPEFTVHLDDTEILENNYEAPPFSSTFWGDRYIQLDWQGPLVGPSPGDYGKVKVKSLNGFARVQAYGDPRVMFGYGAAGGGMYEPISAASDGLEGFRVDIKGTEEVPLEFGLFLYGELDGRTQLWSSDPFVLGPGEGKVDYLFPLSQTFTGYGDSGYFTATIFDLLDYLTGVAVVFRGDRNPDVDFKVKEFDFLFNVFPPGGEGGGITLGGGAQIPEPATLGLLALGSLVALRRRRR